MFPGSYVPRVPCSPGPMFPGSHVPRVLCSPGPMFPGSHVPRVLCWGGGDWVYSRKYCHRCWHIVAYVGIYSYTHECWHFVAYEYVDTYWNINWCSQVTKCHNLVPISVNWYQVYITKLLNIVYYFSKFSCSSHARSILLSIFSCPMFNILSILWVKNNLNPYTLTKTWTISLLNIGHANLFKNIMRAWAREFAKVIHNI